MNFPNVCVWATCLTFELRCFYKSFQADSRVKKKKPKHGVKRTKRDVACTINRVGFFAVRLPNAFLPIGVTSTTRDALSRSEQYIRHDA